MERTIYVHVESEESSLARAMEAARLIDAGQQLAQKEHLSFADLGAYLSCFSPKRVELLARLRETGPTSIRSLARTIGRDFKSVHHDLAKLLDLGLVAKREDGKIEAPYDRIVSEIRLAAA